MVDLVSSQFNLLLSVQSASSVSHSAINQSLQLSDFLQYLTPHTPAFIQRSYFMARRILSLIFFMIPIMTHAQQPTIEYTLGMSKPSTHLMEIEVTYSNLPSGEAAIDLSLPIWRSGRYVVFDFAGGIQDFSAVDGNGKSLSGRRRIKPHGASRNKARRNSLPATRCSRTSSTFVRKG